MAIGPVQLVVFGFTQPRFQGEILEELDRLRDNDVVRVVDALVVYKHASGNVEGIQGSQLGAEEMARRRGWRQLPRPRLARSGAGGRGRGAGPAERDAVHLQT